jgi:hypothetical protein
MQCAESLRAQAYFDGELDAFWVAEPEEYGCLEPWSFRAWEFSPGPLVLAVTAMGRLRDLSKNERNRRLLHAVAATLQARGFSPNIILSPRGRSCDRNGATRR